MESIVKPNEGESFAHQDFDQMHHKGLLNVGLGKKEFDEHHDHFKANTRNLHHEHVKLLTSGYGFQGFEFPTNTDELKHNIGHSTEAFDHAAGTYSHHTKKINTRIDLPPERRTEVHNHEIGHAVDHIHGYLHVGSLHSEHPEFLTAYGEEIHKPATGPPWKHPIKHPLGEYAATSPMEGFAEAYRLISNKKTEKQVAKRTPKIYEYMKNKVFIGHGEKIKS